MSRWIHDRENDGLDSVETTNVLSIYALVNDFWQLGTFGSLSAGTPVAFGGRGASEEEKRAGQGQKQKL